MLQTVAGLAFLFGIGVTLVTNNAQIGTLAIGGAFVVLAVMAAISKFG